MDLLILRAIISLIAFPARMNRFSVRDLNFFMRKPHSSASVKVILSSPPQTNARVLSVRSFPSRRIFVRGLFSKIGSFMPLMELQMQRTVYAVHHRTALHSGPLFDHFCPSQQV